MCITHTKEVTESGRNLVFYKWVLFYDIFFCFPFHTHIEANVNFLQEDKSCGGFLITRWTCELGFIFLRKFIVLAFSFQKVLQEYLGNKSMSIKHLPIMGGKPMLSIFVVTTLEFNRNSNILLDEVTFPMKYFKWSIFASTTSYIQSSEFS